MRHFSLFVALLALFVALSRPVSAQTAASSGPASASADPALQEIATLREGLVDAFNKKDIDKLLTFLHPDIVVTWQNGEVSQGKDAVRAFYTRMMVGDSAIVDSITSAPVVEGRAINGDTSISFGHMNDTFKLKDGMEFHLDSRFSAWLARDNGRWLVRGFHISANVFDNDIQKAYVHKTALWTAVCAGIGGLLVGLILARLTRKAVRA